MANFTTATTVSTSVWPVRSTHQAIAITRSASTDTHEAHIAEDGILTISSTESTSPAALPVFVQKTKDLRACVKLNRAGVQMLKALLNADTLPIDASSERWPVRSSQQAIAITHSEDTDTHGFTFAEDGILTIFLHDHAELPAPVEVTRALPGCVKLHREDVATLTRFLAEVA